MVPRALRQVHELSAVLWRPVSDRIASSTEPSLIDSFYRFYLFVCSVCNHGTEYIRRLKMTIEEVVHLMLFNLNVHHGRYYFSLSNIIYPYIKDNWSALQLSPKVLPSPVSVDFRY